MAGTELVVRRSHSSVGAFVVAAVLSASLVLMAPARPAAATAAVPSIVGWNGGTAVVSEQVNILVVNAPGTQMRVIEVAVERSPAGAGNWSDVVNEYPYYSQFATSDQTNLPFTVPKASFQGGFDYRVRTRQWVQGQGADPSQYSGWLNFSVNASATKPIAPYPLFPRGETAPSGVILRADSSAIPLSAGQPISSYRFEIKTAHDVYDGSVDAVSQWSATVAAPSPGNVAEAPVDNCQSLGNLGLCTGNGNLTYDPERGVQLRWRVRALSTGNPASDWSRWRYFDTRRSQGDYWYVPNRAGSYQAGPSSGDEASGLVASKQYPGIFWFIRDAGKPEDRNKLYAIRIDPATGRLDNIDGMTTKEIAVNGVDNVDWESLSIDDSGNIWIGDVGNYYRDDTPGLPTSQAEGQDRYRNSTSEPDLRLFRVPEPNPETATSVTATKTAPFKYPDDGEYNSESTFWLGGSMFLITKAVSGPQKVFRFPSYISATQTQNVLRYVGDLGVELPPITDATVSPSNAKLALTVEGSRAVIYERPPQSASTSAEAEAIVKSFLIHGEPGHHYYYRSAGALAVDGQLGSARPQPGPGGQWNQTTMAIEGAAWGDGERLNMISEFGNHVISVPRHTNQSFQIDPSRDNYSYWGWGVRAGSGNGLPSAPGNGSESTPPTGEPTPSAAVPLPAGSTWNYRDTGVAPPGFEKPTYFGTGWKTGKAQLGAGDGDETTVINRNNPKHITDYFRRSFEISGVENYQQLDLRMVIDDGAIVYINGVPVIYRNMASVPTPSPNAYALSGVYGANESAIVSKKLVNPPLKEGTNWIAVEVHQAGPNSSDTSFDLELRQHTNLPAATFSISGSIDVDGVTLEAQWAAVAGATSHQLYRRNLLSSDLGWYLVETYPGEATSGTYTPPAPETELADYRMTSTIAGTESTATFGERILFTQDPNFDISDVGYYMASGDINVDTAPVPTPGGVLATAIPLTAAASADPILGDEIAIALLALAAGGGAQILLWSGVDYATTDGIKLDRMSVDADAERKARATNRAKDHIKRFVQGTLGLSAAMGTATAVACISAVEDAVAAGADLPGADAWGLINGEHPCKTMSIHMPGPRSSGGRDQTETYAHQVDALNAAPYWHVLTRAATPASGVSHAWKNSYDPCNTKTSLQACDEFPYHKTSEGGPAIGFPNTGAWLRLVPKTEVSPQGGDVGGFYTKCNIGVPERYLVVPLPEIVHPVTENTIRICS